MLRKFAVKDDKTTLNLFWLSILLVLTAAAGPVQAAPTNQCKGNCTASKYKLAVYMPDAPYCVGDDYEIRVRPVVTSEIKDYRVPGVSPGTEKSLGTVTRVDPVWGIKIEALVKDENIATLSPPDRLVMDVEPDEFGLGNVYFTLTPKKAGTTELYFETKVTDTVNNKSIYIAESRSIKVVSCEYEVTATYSLNYSSGFTMSLTGSMRDVRLKPNGGYLEGSGEMYFVGSGTGDPSCQVTLSFGSSTVDMRGKVSEGKYGEKEVNINFSYGPMNQSFTNACPMGTGTGGVNQPPPTAAIKNLTFSSNGGTQSRYLLMGGVLTVTVVPVYEEGK